MMALTPARITKSSKSVSIRKCPWDPLKDEEVNAKKFKPGDLVKVNVDDLVYDWTDQSFYAMHDPYTGSPIGYINTKAVVIERSVKTHGRNSNAG